MANEVPAHQSTDESTSPGAPRGGPPAASGRRRWPWVLAVVVIAIVATIVVSRSIRSQANDSGAKPGAAARAIPVVGVKTRVGDLGVYESGLGTVMPLATVTVRSRVDGQLNTVAYREGQLVHRGDLLAQLDPRPFQVQLLQAEAQQAKDEAALKAARVDLARYQVLIAQDSIPRQQLDAQAATVDQDEAALKNDQAQIESAKLNLTYARITAPISGVVGLRLVDVGNIVHAADPNGLVVITQEQPITVVFTIPADRLPDVLQQRESGRPLTVEAWDRAFTNKLATGQVLAIDNQIDPGTGTVRIKALFSNDDSALYPNQFVNARLLVSTLEHVVLAPTAAIQRSPQSTFVYVVKPDATVEMRNVTVQRTEGEDTAISKGLREDETVVVDGVDKLQPGVKVAVAGPTGGAGKRRS